jgi:UDP-2,3-diacylglucosamine pyrophosphatase LpxH
MKRFILSDLHIGHPDAEYDVMEKIVDYISQNYENGDEIWGLGDWFHIDDGIGFDSCLTNPLARKFGDLAAKVPTKVMPGNHDKELEEYQDGRKLPDPISSISIIKPFMDNGVWYCHGHEYDPALVPLHLIGIVITWFKSVFMHKKRATPGAIKATIKGEPITNFYLASVQPVQIGAVLDARDNKHCKGIVFGHTHFPVYQESPDLGVFLLNDGDMRGSSTFVLAKDNQFQFMTWSSVQKAWQTMPIL